MPATAMNHFTILTNDLEGTVAFYAECLDLHPGNRPPFKFPGAWLYAQGGAEPILHVIAGQDPSVLVKGVIDHMAFTGRDLAGTLARLEARGMTYDLRQLPGWGTWQLFFHDPNNARIELDFDASERSVPA
jgi:catechol 2,3-dioxygenase-like lactoylglutathione lyase family enzyme